MISFKRSFIVLLVIASSNVWATTNDLIGTITGTLFTEGRFGNCMAKPSVNPKQRLGACSPNWVSFACDGSSSSISKDTGEQLFEMAQIFEQTGQEIQLFIDDQDTTPEGFCIVYRIQSIL